MKRLLRLLKDQRAATAVEYGLILAMIFLAMIVAVRGVASVTTGMWNNISTEVLGA